MLSFGNWLAIQKTPPTEKSILIQIYLNYIEIYTLNGTIKVCFAELSLWNTISKRSQGEELDDDCETDSPITMLLLSFRVLTAVIAGDWRTLRESLILPSAGSRPKYLTYVKEAYLKLKKTFKFMLCR